MYVYANTLFDISSDFDEMLEDYFSHAYGEDWREVKKFFEGLYDVFDPAYLIGRKYTDPNRKFYDPAQGQKMRGVYKLVEEFKPFLESHKIMPYRAQSVAYKLLRYYTEWCTGIAKPSMLKAYGADEMAAEAFNEFLAEFGVHEQEIEAYCDQHMFGMAFDNRFLNKLHVMIVND